MKLAVEGFWFCADSDISDDSTARLYLDYQEILQRIDELLVKYNEFIPHHLTNSYGNDINIYKDLKRVLLTTSSVLEYARIKAEYRPISFMTNYATPNRFGADILSTYSEAMPCRNYQGRMDDPSCKISVATHSYRHGARRFNLQDPPLCYNADEYTIVAHDVNNLATSVSVYDYVVNLERGFNGDLTKSMMKISQKLTADKEGILPYLGYRQTYSLQFGQISEPGKFYCEAMSFNFPIRNICVNVAIYFPIEHESTGLEKTVANVKFVKRFLTHMFVGISLILLRVKDRWLRFDDMICLTKVVKKFAGTECRIHARYLVSNFEMN